MIELILDNAFKQSYTKWRNKHLNLVDLFKEKLKLFSEEPFNPILKTHSLSGILKGLWAFNINYKYRVIFKFITKDKQKVLLIDIGTHDEVY